MSSRTEKQNRYLQEFHKLEKSLPGQGYSWLEKIRCSAIERFVELGFPTEKNEEWIFTNVDRIAETAFKPFAGTVPKNISPEKIKSHVLGTGIARSAYELVFLDGQFSSELSSPQLSEKGVKAGSIASFLSEHPGLIEPFLGQQADSHGRAFTALNSAFFNDGAFVQIAKGVEMDRPIHLLFVKTSSGRTSDAKTAAPAIIHPRILIVAEESSRASILESYVGSGSDVYFTNTVSEIVLGENSHLEHCKLQLESRKAFHIGSLDVRQEANSTFTSHSISIGAALTRNDVNSMLSGSGAHCTLNGLYTVQAHQHVDHHTSIDHASAHCTSRELYKGVLYSKARAIFNGRIVVRKDAQKTDAEQSNKNLLLAEDALINTKPELMIFANDVKCKHGATIGRLDPGMLFYMRSRGIAEEQARSMLIFAFADEMINRIKDAAIQGRVRKVLQGVAA